MICPFDPSHPKTEQINAEDTFHCRERQGAIQKRKGQILKWNKQMIRIVAVVLTGIKQWLER